MSIELNGTQVRIPIIPSANLTSAYKAGYDCGKNGANGANCDISFFARAELTKEWERGKRDACVPNANGNT